MKIATVSLKHLVFASIISVFAIRANAQTYSMGVIAGYNGGPGLQLNGMIADLSREFPVKIKAGLGYISLNPGDAVAVRRIFINNATNGTPQKKGGKWDFRMDFQFPVHWFSMKRAYFYGGPRYSMFTGNFNYVGGNEDFEITCKQWGVGIGLEKYFRISRRLELVTITGFDYFMSSDLTGHDTTYGPNSEPINGREDYNYKDADNAVNQPNYELRLMFGINYYLSFASRPASKLTRRYKR